MDAWQDILRTALVGTERQPPAFPAFPGELGRTLTALPANEPERALLSAAAVLSLYQSAGHLPSQSAASAAAAPPEQLQPISARAASHLPELITGDHTALLPEFLAACAAAANLRIPHRHLPALLDRAASNRDLRDAILKVIGTRGQWLMSLNPAWQFDSAPDASPDTWQIGTRDQRLAFLKRLRAADPAAARGLVRATWPQETPEDRAAFLATFSVNLSADDEPLLEESLDDRRKEVRTAAADLLARLPKSQLVARMLDRLKPLIQIDVAQRGKVMKLVAGQKNKVTLTATPPDACDKACQRDGVDAKPPAGFGIGEKAWLLEQMLAVVPPCAWTAGEGDGSQASRLIGAGGADRVGISPDELLGAATTSEWRDALIGGWTRAAIRHPDPAWSRALLTYYLDPPPAKKKTNNVDFAEYSGILEELVATVPQKELESTLLAALEASSEKLKSHPGLRVLQAHTRPWGRDLSRVVLMRVRLELTARGDYDLYEWVQTDLGRLLSPDVAPQACDPNWTPHSFWENPVSKMRTLLQLRHDMLTSLKEK